MENTYPDGELFICGRLKDIIIIRGRNFYPQDIEWSVSELPGIRRGNVVAFAVSVVALAGFVVRERRTEHPMFDLGLLRDRRFGSASVGISLCFFAMFGVMFLLAQYLQLVLGYGTLKAAGALMPMAVIAVPLSAVAAVLAERYGQRLIGGAGLLISAVGFGGFTLLSTDSGYIEFLICLLFVGIGSSLAMTPATNAIVSSLPRAKQGVASAVNDTARELGAAFGVAVLGSAFNIGYRHDIDRSLTNLAPDAVERAREAPALAIQLGDSTNDAGLIASARDAFIVGMRYALAVGAILLLVGALFLWIRGVRHDEEILEDELDAESLDSAGLDVAPGPQPEPVG